MHLWYKGSCFEVSKDSEFVFQSAESAKYYASDTFAEK